MRVFGYARVSSREQALGTSLQDQQNVLQAYAQTRGLTVSAQYVEAESAVHEKFERREKIQQLMQELRKGDLVLCDKLDRWSRDPEFTYRSMREAREAGARVYFVGDQIDPTTPEGDSMLNMRVLMAREEHKRIKLRTVGTRKLLRNQGLYVEGPAPFGYRRQLPKGQRGLEKNALVSVPEQARVLKEFFRQSSIGCSVGDLLKYARSEHPVRKWDKSSIHKMLRNRVYLGEVRDSNGVWIRGRHEALITQVQFNRVSDGLTTRRLGGARLASDSHTKNWLLRGFSRCALCDARMGAAYGGGRETNRDYVFYYRCAQGCGARLVPVDLMDADVEILALARLRELRSALRRPSIPPPAAVDYVAQRAKLEQRRERLLDAHVDGHITRQQLSERMAKLDAERGHIETTEAEQLRRAATADPKTRRETLQTVDGIQKAWAQMAPEKRRAVVMALAKTCSIQRDKPPEIVWRTENELNLQVE